MPSLTHQTKFGLCFKLKYNHSVKKLLLLLILALLIGAGWKGIFIIFYKYNTLLVIAYFCFLFPIAFYHTIFLGLFGDSKEEILKKKAKEQAQFDKLVEEEKNK